jgi:hypothetical protein
MSSNPYIRRGLEATRLQIPDPEIEIDDWLDKLGDLLDERSLQRRVHQAYDLFALCAKLKRVRPTLLAKHDMNGVLKSAEAIVAEKGHDLVQQALTIPNPEAWLQDAPNLVDSYEDLIDPAQRAELAENLLVDLDDAELVMYSANRLGVNDAALKRDLETCADWVAKHADFFLAAAVHVQAVGMTLRPDLGEQDPELARTAEKYVQVLDAQEIAEAELSFANQPRVDRAVVQQMFSFARKKSALSVVVPVAGAHEWFEWPDSIMAAAKAGPASDEVHLDWRSPDHKCTATLVFDPQGTDPVRVNFYHGTALAEILAGQRAVLAGVDAGKPIDLQGNADFARDFLQQARSQGRHLTLQVGVDFWKPIQRLEK